MVGNNYGTHCHVLIAKTAKEFAGELYETLMSNNDIYSAWCRQNPGLDDSRLRLRFVARNWGRCIDPARATLAHMLTTPIPDLLKDQILDDLIKDKSLMKGREAGMQVVGQVAGPRG